MDPREFPTKGNLMLAKNSLALANQGYELMDKKRNILLKELMGLIDEAKGIQEEIDSTFTQAYACLQRANIEMGISRVQEFAFTVPIEDSIRIQTRSIMGTEIPHIKYDEKQNDLTYSFGDTGESLDIAREAFRKVKNLTIKLAEVENSAYRLATNINTETCQCSEEHHYTDVHEFGLQHQQRAGRKRKRRIHKTESNKTKTIMNLMGA